MDKVTHFEIPADDLKRAQKFYSAAFGWKVNLIPQFSYAILETTPVDEKSHLSKEPGAINGGMMKRVDYLPSPIVTIQVADMDAAVKKLEKAGGKVIRAKMPVGDMGLAAYFKDTEGNILGLWQPLRPH